MALKSASIVIRFCALFLLVGCGGSAGSSRPEMTGQSGPHAERRGPFFIGFDASPPLIDALRAGAIQGLVVQNPYRMGELGVRTLVDHLEGKVVPKAVSTGETLVTPENMDEPEIQAALNPPKAENEVDGSLSGKKAKRWRVMVIPKGTTHEFWKSIHAGAEKAARDHGDVEIYWKGPQKEDDRAEQIALLRTASKLNVDGVVLAPLDAEGLVGAVDEVMAAGVPVVIFDSALRSDRPVSYVATDNYHGGVLAAERLASLLHGEGRIILVRYMPGSASTEEREKGFTDTMKKYPGIHYLSNNQYAMATSETAQKTAQSLVARFRGQIDGIFCPNESSTSGMLRALREAGLLVPRR